MLNLPHISLYLPLLNFSSHEFHRRELFFRPNVHWNAELQKRAPKPASVKSKPIVKHSGIQDRTGLLLQFKLPNGQSSTSNYYIETSATTGARMRARRATRMRIRTTTTTVTRTRHARPPVHPCARPSAPPPARPPVHSSARYFHAYRFVTLVLYSALSALCSALSSALSSALFNFL